MEWNCDVVVSLFCAPTRGWVLERNRVGNGMATWAAASKMKKSDYSNPLYFRQCMGTFEIITAGDPRIYLLSKKEHAVKYKYNRHYLNLTHEPLHNLYQKYNSTRVYAPFCTVCVHISRLDGLLFTALLWE